MQKKTSVTLGDSLCISQASTMHSRLKRALQKSTTVEIKADAIEKTDTAGLQLLLAFKKHLDSQGGELRWHKPTKVFLDSAEMLGLFEDLGLHY